MRKKTSSMDRAKRGKVNRKLSDLAPKLVKGGDAAAVKGGVPAVQKVREAAARTQCANNLKQ